MTKLIKTRVEIEGRVSEEWALVEENDAARPWDVEEELKVVGQPQPRVDGAARAGGRARFTHDIRLPGMLHSAFLRSPHAHARIRAIDTREAEALPGVWAVFTHANTQVEWRKGMNILADVVRFQGEEVAFVVADTPEHARAACARIRVDYEPLPFALDAQTAMQAGAPSVRDTARNLLDGETEEYTRGDVAQGFAQADAVVEHTYRTPTALHNALETHGSVAAWEGDQLTLYDSTQYIFGVRARVANLLNMPRSHVRVIKQYMGGGFGAKNSTGKYTVLAALAARQLGRPVRAVLTRREENLATGHRSPSVQRVKLGARRDGTLTAIEVEAWAALGAYAGWRPGLGSPAQELYRCPHVHTVEYGVFTHSSPYAAFRAPGYVEGIFALESAMDELAAALNLDPLELRKRNYIDHDQKSKRPYSTRGLMDAWLTGAQHVNWTAVRAQPPGDGPVKRGWGMASQCWGGSGGPPSYAIARLNPDGTLIVQSGTQDIGTGTRTVLAQIAAEELGLPLARVTIQLGDTEAGPYGQISAGSMTVASVGPAVRSACADARRKLLDIARQRHDYQGELTIEDGVIRGAGYPPAAEEGAPSGEGLAIRDLLDELGDVEIIGYGSRGPNDDKLAVQTFGAQFAHVEVDTDTGAVRVLKIVAVHDCGRIINPLTTSSQVEGGVIQGVGFALTEQRVIDPQTGVVLTDSLESYRVPTILDTPEIETVMLDHADRAANNLGAKGVGEPPIIPTAAAIANAIAHATGVRVRELPITHDRMLEALAEAESGS